ncbi:MAG: ISAs1 family transposase [Streptosporangiaceae bacterium]
MAGYHTSLIAPRGTMPAPSSSLIDPAIGHLAELAADTAGDSPGLLTVLAGVADPRRRRGVRHRLLVILGLAVCAVLGGARSFTAIAEWAADADQETLARLGVTGAVPSESTFRRTLQRLDADAFDDLAGKWAARCTAPGRGGRRVIAVDGKTLRGSGHGSDGSRHLLAALDHAHGAVLGQVEVGAKTNEIPLFSALLDRLDITGAVITAYALHAQRDHATYLAGRGAHYLLIVKRNQPGLHAQLACLPWRDVPVAYQARERGHGRTERRILKVTAVARGLAFPHAARAIQITRRREVKGKWSRETCYAVTSLTISQASHAQVAAIIRGHWGIEDRLHWVRDMDFDEDRSQVRTASGPRIMASLRNLVITILRLAGAASIAAALRYQARRPSRPLQTIMKC